VGLAISGVAAGCASPVPHAFEGPGLPEGARVAILPLVNYTTSRDAPDRVLPALGVALRTRKHLEVVDPGIVEQALATNPWLSPERMPPDVVDSLGVATGANALLVGSVLAYGYRAGEAPQVPEVSFAVKLVETPGGRCLWSAVFSRDGGDRERLFGIGRIESLEKLADEAVTELVDTLPVRSRTGADVAAPKATPAEGTSR
jgi:hypothetical protein